MSSFRQTPTYEQPIVVDKNTSSVWYRYFGAIDHGVPPSGELVVSVGASPFTYTAPQGGFVIIDAAAQVEFSRTPGMFYVTGQLAGCFPMSANDQVRITYTSVPQVVFVPQ